MFSIKIKPSIVKKFPMVLGIIIMILIILGIIFRSSVIAWYFFHIKHDNSPTANITMQGAKTNSYTVTIDVSACDDQGEWKDPSSGVFGKEDILIKGKYKNTCFIEIKYYGGFESFDGSQYCEIPTEVGEIRFNGNNRMLSWSFYEEHIVDKSHNVIEKYCHS